MILGAGEGAEATTTITSDGMSGGNWTIGNYTVNATKWSSLYTQDIEVDTTIEGAAAVHIRAAADASQAKVKDALKMSAYLVDVSDEEFMCYNRSGSYLPQTVISAAADGEGAWMGGGLKNFDLVKYNQTSAKTKIIAKGWMDLCNPEAGYDSASAARSACVDVNGETFYDYTLYLQPTLYTVQAGHRLALVIFTDTSTDSYGVYTITVDNANTYADIPVVNETNITPNPVFTDVAEDAVYYDAVLWGNAKGIVSGFSATEFHPNGLCTRAQAVTFLWRAAGCPEPSSTNNPFKDVSAKQTNGKDNPYYKAILWGVERGITAGYSDGTFHPNDTITRAQFVTFLWRYGGQPDSTGDIGSFKDAASISKPYQKAVAWGAENGIIAGYGDGTFRPNATCTRWQVVLFMYRDMK